MHSASLQGCHGGGRPAYLPANQRLCKRLADVLLLADECIPARLPGVLRHLMHHTIILMVQTLNTPCKTQGLMSFLALLC